MKFKHFLGIDISKKTFNVALLGLGSSAFLGEAQFAHTAQGFKSFYRWLIQQVGKSALSSVVICLEHTGLYDLELSVFLHDYSLAYSHGNALAVKRSMGILRGKSDRIDARRLATYIRKERDDLQLSKPAPRVFIHLHRLFAARELLVKQKRAQKQHKGALSALKSDTEIRKIESMYQKMERDFDRHLLKIEARMKALIQGHKDLKKNYELLLSVPGIGPMNAIYFLITTKNFTAFATWRQYAAYAGTAPFEHRSGTSVRGKNKVHSFANKKAKTLLTSAASSAKVHCFEIKAFYEKKLKAGKEKFWIINAIRNKIIARVFAIIERQSDYKSVDYYQKWKQQLEAA